MIFSVDIGLWELLYSVDQHYLNCKYYMLSDFHGYRLFMIYVCVFVSYIRLVSIRFDFEHIKEKNINK